MAAVAYIDAIENLTCQERFGVIIRAERLVHVHNIDTQVDWQILTAALTTAGVPVNGASLGTGAESVVLTERNPTVVDHNKVDVRLVYEHMVSEGHNMDATPLGYNLGEVRVNIQQITTDKDRDGNKVTVAHTFPSLTLDPDGGDYAGQTITQAGEFSVFIPQKTVTFRGMKTTNEPWVIADYLVGAINSDVWRGAAKHTWMITACDYKIYNTKSGAHTYMFTFEMQYNPDTWNPYVVFINPKTGKPPINLVKDTGWKYITYHREVEFQKQIPPVEGK